MATIGIFKKQDNGSFQGTLKTLTINTKVSIEQVENKTGDKTPDFRVVASGIEIGAGWTHTSKQDNPYVAVKLDDPSFPAPISANLVAHKGDYILIWKR